MKKVIFAMAMMGITTCGAFAQSLEDVTYTFTHFSTVLPEDGQQATTPAVEHPKRVYTNYRNLEYDENYPVCKGDIGYFICTETPGAYNSTHPMCLPGTTAMQMQTNDYFPSNTNSYNNVNADAASTTETTEDTAPESQSYPSAEELHAESAFLTRGLSRDYVDVAYRR